MERVLFVCIKNSARSQIAEAFVNHLCVDAVVAESAGFEPGDLNPLAIEVMREIGIDISANKTKGVFAMFAAGKMFDYVITVCDQASAERCPIFPGIVRRLHWSFADPATFAGTWDEQLAQTRVVRDAIRDQVRAWCSELTQAPITSSCEPGG